MMKAAGISETSVWSYQVTWPQISSNSTCHQGRWWWWRQ